MKMKKICFPIYTGYYLGYNYYKDKYIYLLSRLINIKKVIYPDFITDEGGGLELENKKRYFRNSLINYDLDNNYILYFKNIKKDKKEDLQIRRNNNRHIKKTIMNMN